MVVITTTDYYCCGEVETVIQILVMFGIVAAVLTFVGVTKVRNANRGRQAPMDNQLAGMPTPRNLTCI